MTRPAVCRLPSAQRGASTLILTVVVLALTTLLALSGNRSVLTELKTSTNQYWYAAAFQAAQGSLEYTIAWLATSGKTKGSAWNSAWVSDPSHPPFDQRNSTSVPARSFGPYGTTVRLWRHASRKSIVEIEATSTSADGTSATVRQIVAVAGPLSFNATSVPPLTVNGCISGVTGTPDIVGTDANGTSIEASGAAACVDTGHFNLTGTVKTNAFTGSAWDHVFSSSKADAILTAHAQPAGPASGPIYYYDDSTVASYVPSNLGTPASPIVLIFDISSGSCPKISGGHTIYGIVYCGQGFDMQGWGGTTIHGAMIVETSITKFTAGTVLKSDGVATVTDNYDTTPAVARVAGTWRDF